MTLEGLTRENIAEQNCSACKQPIGKPNAAIIRPTGIGEEVEVWHCACLFKEIAKQAD